MLSISSTKISGITIVETSSLYDNRGYFSRLFCENELSPILNGRRIVQINQSKTHQTGAIRGLHYQTAPSAEMKFIRCIRGCVWDIGLDLRKDSPTFLQWHAEILSEENKKMIVLSEGIAHGFQVLESNSELLYLHTAQYNSRTEGAVRYNDPMANINWPLACSDISDRDRQHKLLDSNFSGFIV
ncbi:MAG: dTDP-4-dehydrorhamnose 3,5-epimerase family protein [Gammaproteobacteria bacterium]|nr:dTDP-4-dehydrorhamnose 3,5-epimerase family protein [Gammaproteobacteria bacterium]